MPQWSRIELQPWPPTGSHAGLPRLLHRAHLSITRNQVKFCLAGFQFWLVWLQQRLQQSQTATEIITPPERDSRFRNPNRALANAKKIHF